jgi:hypothetical protein
MLNPEQFGLSAQAAPWAGVRQLGTLAMGPARETNPIIAFMEQNKAERRALFAGRRLDLRPRGPILSVGTQAPPLSDAERRGQ